VWECRKLVAKKTKKLASANGREEGEPGSNKAVATGNRPFLEHEDIKWKQWAKQHWYQKGDRNTVFSMLGRAIERGSIILRR
jgi:hypothetical protein